MKRMSFVVGLAAVAVSTTLSAATVSVSSEDVFADAYIWMRGMAIDKNGNHILDVGEITNSLNTVVLTTGTYGAAGHKPVISNEFVRLPGRGVGRQMQTLYFPQDVVWTNETQTLGYVTPCSVTCGTPLKDFDSQYTWIIRFRPDFSEPLLDTQWLLGFGYGSSRGMMFGLAETSTERRALRVYTTNGSWDLGESFVISNGCGWVDFAVTVDGQEVTAYLVKDGLTTPDGNTDIGLLKRASQTYAGSVNLVPNPGTVLRFGTESPQNGKYPMPAPSSGNNHYKCFRGSIQQFACWKRTLSEQEILAALGWPRAETWRVGVENDATTELSADTAPEGGFDVDGELWPVPNGGLTNGVSVSFKFPVEAGYDDGRAQIFRWKATSDSAEGRLGVRVNGKPLGNRSIKAGETQRWFVPAAALTVGTNTLTVTRIDSGTGVVTLDAAALGGGWQVGRRDDDWTDFGHEGAVSNDYHVVDGNMRHVPRAMLYTGTGDRTSWHAVMPRSLAGEYDWILHFRTGPEGGGTGTRLCIDLNGERLATKDAPGTKTDHPFAIPRELLKAGENVFSFLNDTQSGTDSISIDSVWLEPVAPEPAAPEFTSSASATEGVQNGNIEFTFSDLLSDGYPAPTYTITTAVSTGEYNFDGDTGYLFFQPTNTGDFTFTCVASNEYGTATNTLAVTVTAAPVTVPELTVTDITDTTALATWTACDGVASYTVQLASDNQFTTGGSGGEVTLFSNDGTAPSAAPDDWTYNLHNTSGSYLQLMSGNYVVSEAFDASACTDLTLSLYMRTYGGTTYPSVTVEYSTDGGTTWSEPLGTLSAANSTMAERTLDVSDAAGASSVRLRIASTSTSSTIGVGIKTIVLTGTKSSGSGSLIAEYTVDTTDYTFTGLAPATVYYARVKGDAGWSNTKEFLTAQTLTPFEQWLADHDASGHTPDQVAPNGHTYWDNYIADIDPGDMFLTIKLDPASGTLTIPAASPNRIYTLIWTTDLSTDKDKWKEVSLCQVTVRS